MSATGKPPGTKTVCSTAALILPLTEHGHRQAASVAAYLQDIQIDTILISELQRAKQTAEYIRAPETHHYHCDPRLNEMHFGEWEMQHYSEIAGPLPGGLGNLDE
ncbi:Alpha-ribazole phosphatase [Morganella morganii]|nr:Alpha-ribazole phosphatase [Morganella morganii]